jgi:hypothetical protein
MKGETVKAKVKSEKSKQTPFPAVRLFTFDLVLLPCVHPPCENSSCRDFVAFVRLLVLTPFYRIALMKWHIRDLRRRFSSWW